MSKEKIKEMTSGTEGAVVIQQTSLYNRLVQAEVDLENTAEELVEGLEELVYLQQQGVEAVERMKKTLKAKLEKSLGEGFWNGGKDD